MPARTVLWLGAAIALGLGGCGDDDGPRRDAGPADDGGADAGGRDGGPDAGRDGGPTGDGNDTAAEADPITLGGDGVSGVISPPGDRDWYRFEGTAGQWVAISTDANPEDDPEMVDTVITLYDSSLTQIAENDDGVPRASTDSELITRLPADGTYYVEVQEYSDWAGETPEGDPSFSYTLTIIEVDPAAAAVTVDAEAGDDGTTAQALPFSMDFQFLLGTFRDDVDVDVYSFTIDGTEPRLFQATLMPAGADGYGSTKPAGEVWITDETGAVIIARIDQSAGLEEIGPSLAPGVHVLWVAHPGGGAGGNDFYVAKVLRGAENTPESGASNETLAEAETIAMTPAPDGTRRSAFVLAHLDAESDVDYFAVDVEAGETLSVACGSASSGSGVLGLRAEIRDGTDGVVQGGTETLTDGIFLDRVTLPGAGTYYLRLSKTGQDAEVTGDWVRCGVHAISGA